ncbi:glycosyltransferase family protein [Colwellia sp. 6_MG-2023]|uniref:MJ1255/VC2487 family glycosyltransferase n=1 Tax=Colwellia sp. 6_MG-2023 TaxID=3062676 RepID=UPI0026E2C121|nr:MJ1255/VC2487 family glycosyltransferase [Colwellia sp. 6_MG-2023]MDO6489442.1 glycosyltransferase family protein [Colwellia sp. 6_MG-2023]
MKILYGVQATGNGHIARSRIMAKQLKENGVEVTFLFSGRPKDKLFDMEIFGDFIYKQGLTFIVQNGKVNYLATAFNNNFLRFIYDAHTLAIDDYDLIITDFEPVTAWAAKLKKKPVLGIGHQYAFGHNTPRAGKSLLAEFVMNYFAPAKDSIGLHWAPFEQSTLPPIIDVGLTGKMDEDVVLVYLPFENQSKVTKLLQQFPSKHFIQYSPDVNNTEDKNVSIRATCYAGFKQDLCRASAVISNSGFELISECLHLGLPLLVKPLQGQMEQESNALALHDLKFAEVMRTLDEDIVADWLEKCKPRINKKTPDVAFEIVKWLLSEQRLPIDKVAASLWQQYE